MIVLRFLIPVLCAGALIIAPARALAADPSAGDDWQFNAGVYLWGADIQADAASGSEVDISFDDLINNLNMAFMGTFEARKSKWSFAADIIYLNVGVDGGGTIPVTIGSSPDADFLAKVNVDAHVDLRAWVQTYTGGYNLWQSERGTLDLIAGLRYLEIKVSLEPTVKIGGLGATVEDSGAGINWDGIIGVKGEIKLKDNWYVPYHLDIGTGDSDYTWQIATGIGYKFDWGDVNLVYRYMDWDLASGGDLDDLNLSGPQLGARFHF